jgi:hypothetical protein
VIYLALAFCILFSVFFIFETKKSLSQGIVKSRGSVWARNDRPILFWFGIAAWLVNVIAGAAFTAALASILLNGQQS